MGERKRSGEEKGKVRRGRRKRREERKLERRDWGIAIPSFA